MQRHALLAILVALTLAACSKKPPPAPPPRQVLTVLGTAWEVIDGSWYVEGDVLVGVGGHVETKSQMGDGTVEMDIEQAPSSAASSGAGNTIGIGYRHSLPNGDLARANGYALNLQNPKFTVVRGANNYWQPVTADLRGYQPSGFFDPRKNHVAIHMTGKSFGIDLNGNSLTAFDDPSYEHGHTALWVESTTDPVRFSNVHFATK